MMRWLSCVAAAVVGLGWLGTSLHAQNDERPLIDTPPFDVVVLTQTAGGKAVKIAPLPQRNYDNRPADTEKLQVVLLSHPERKYEILWRDIEKLNLYERMIYDEAMKKLGEKDFINAFMNLSFLMQNYPKTPNLEKLRRDFLFQSAAVMFAESRSEFSRYFQTMSTLEELRATAPDYEANSVMAGLAKVTDTLLKYYESKGDMASAKQLLARLDKTYGEKLQSVVDWKAKLLNMAEQRKAEAIALMNEGKFREARAAAIDMSNISPDIEGGPALLEEIRRRYPMIRVGVTQRAGDLDPGSLVNWSARRAGALVYRPVVKFMDTGTQGGKYQFALGKDEAERRQSATDDEHRSQDTGRYQRIRSGSNSYATRYPNDATYDPSWPRLSAAYRLPTHSTAGALAASTRFAASSAAIQFPRYTGRRVTTSRSLSPQDSRQERNSFCAARAASRYDVTVEIVEIFYEDPKVAANDLLRGEIDAVDQVYPSDARRYEQSKLAKVGSYYCHLCTCSCRSLSILTWPGISFVER